MYQKLVPDPFLILANNHQQPLHAGNFVKNKIFFESGLSKSLKKSPLFFHRFFFPDKSTIYSELSWVLNCLYINDKIKTKKTVTVEKIRLVFIMSITSPPSLPILDKIYTTLFLILLSKKIARIFLKKVWLTIFCKFLSKSLSYVCDIW